MFMFYRSSFVILSFFFFPLCCKSFFLFTNSDYPFGIFKLFLNFPFILTVLSTCKCHKIPAHMSACSSEASLQCTFLSHTNSVEMHCKPSSHFILDSGHSNSEEQSTYFLIKFNLSRFWISCLDPLFYLLPKNCWGFFFFDGGGGGFQSLAYKHTWWMLSQKRVVHIIWYIYVSIFDNVNVYTIHWLIATIMKRKFTLSA